ncbi:MAG TPA: hypothetical protein VHG89_04685 [Verrucomicrobiae bacterium]|nr:hypothetical protein [Verrucomicrobiae bacterium]
MNTDTLPVKSDTPDANLQLVDGRKLLEIIFPADCRPTLRWLRERQKRREIPCVRLGRLVFFVPAQVRESLSKQWTAAQSRK